MHHEHGHSELPKVVSQFGAVVNVKHFSLLKYRLLLYIYARVNWENSKLCENTAPCFARCVCTQFRVSPVSTRIDITVNLLYLLNIIRTG